MTLLNQFLKVSFFFFAFHNSIFSSPARNCEICFESLEIIHSTDSYPDKDTTCVDCMTKYITHSLQSGNAKIKKIHNKSMRKHNFHGDYYAGGFYDQQDIINFISSLPESVSQRLFTQFDRNLAREAHLKQGDVACPNCDHFFQNPTNKKSWVPQKGTLCRACQKPYILPSFGRIIKDAKRCSHCRAVILKSTGCNRVTCSLCYSSFSWDEAESLDSNTECDMCTIL